MNQEQFDRIESLLVRIATAIEANQAASKIKPSECKHAFEWE